MKRVKLGQYTLVDKGAFKRILEVAEIRPEDKVFEIGAGRGDLTEELCRRASEVISYEIDEELYEAARKRLKDYSNLRLFFGDAFDTKFDFDIIVSNLPYYESSRFIEWLSLKSFNRAVVMVQREFAEKLLAEAGSRKYRAISVLAQLSFNMSIEEKVNRDAFKPSPRVSSVILRMLHKSGVKISFEENLWIKKLFSFRGRKVSAALRSIMKCSHSRLNTLFDSIPQHLMDRRVQALHPDEAIHLIRRIMNCMKV